MRKRKAGRPSRNLKDNLERRVIKNLFVPPKGLVSKRRQGMQFNRLQRVHDFQSRHDGWGNGNLWNKSWQWRGLGLTELIKKAEKEVKKSSASMHVLRGRDQVLRDLRKMSRANTDKNSSKRKVGSSRVSIPLPFSVLFYGVLSDFILNKRDLMPLAELCLKNGESKRWPTFNSILWELDSPQSLRRWATELRNSLQKHIFKHNQILNFLGFVRPIIYNEFLEHPNQGLSEHFLDICEKIYEAQTSLKSIKSKSEDFDKISLKNESDILKFFDVIYLEDLSLGIAYLSNKNFKKYMTYVLQRPIF